MAWRIGRMLLVLSLVGWQDLTPQPQKTNPSQFRACLDGLHTLPKRHGNVQDHGRNAGT